MQHIDARGLSCPEPVVRVQRALKVDETGLSVIVDHVAAVENITRFGRARGYLVEKTTVGKETTLTLTKASV